MKDLIASVFPWVVILGFPLMAILSIIAPPSDRPQIRVIIRCAGGGLIVLYVGFFLGFAVGMKHGASPIPAQVVAQSSPR